MPEITPAILINSLIEYFKEMSEGRICVNNIYSSPEIKLLTSTTVWSVYAEYDLSAIRIKTISYTKRPRSLSIRIDDPHGFRKAWDFLVKYSRIYRGGIDSRVQKYG